MSKDFMGNTALMISLSCDSVIAGAFFPQPDPHVPQEEMGQHAGDHMVAPPRIFSHLIMVHSQIRLGLFKALFDGPAHPGEPDKGLKSGGSAGIRNEVGVCVHTPAEGSADNQPNTSLWFSMLGQNHSLLHKLIGDWTLCPFRDRAEVSGTVYPTEVSGTVYPTIFPFTSSVLFRLP